MSCSRRASAERTREGKRETLTCCPSFTFCPRPSVSAAVVVDERRGGEVVAAAEATRRGRTTRSSSLARGHSARPGRRTTWSSHLARGHSKRPPPHGHSPERLPPRPPHGRPGRHNQACAGAITPSPRLRPPGRGTTWSPRFVRGGLLGVSIKLRFHLTGCQIKSIYCSVVGVVQYIRGTVMIGGC